MAKMLRTLDLNRNFEFDEVTKIFRNWRQNYRHKIEGPEGRSIECAYSNEGEMSLTFLKRDDIVGTTYDAPVSLGEFIELCRREGIFLEIKSRIIL